MSLLKLKKPNGVVSPGAAAPKNIIILVLASEILFFPDTDGKGVAMQGSFALTAGASMTQLEVTKSKTSASMETDGEEDSQSFKPKLELMHPGNSLECKEFVQAFTGKNVVALHKACGDDFYEVMGSPCAPLQLKATKKDDNDGRHWMFTFEAFAKSNSVPRNYYGAIIFANPFPVVVVSSVMVDDASGLQYKLPATIAVSPIVVSSMTLAHGTVVTFIGTGGAIPANLAGGMSGVVTVLLVNGTAWVANDKAIINLKVFRAGSEVYLEELSRG